MIWAATLVFLVALDPWSASELRALADADDVSAVPQLEGALESRLLALSDFPEGLAPPDLEDELVESLLGLERLDPKRALPWCRRALERRSDTRAAWAARAVLARSGDLDVVRTALREYFRAPESWRRVLGAAAHGTGDIRLQAFLPFAEELQPPSEKLFRSRLKQALAGSIAGEEVYGPPLVADSNHVLSVHDHVLSLRAPERFRAIRSLVEDDDRALLGLPMDSETIGRLSPYLARSQYRALRDRVRRASSHRGLALASLLLASVPDDEARAHAEAMPDAWAGSLRASASVYERLVAVVGERALLRWIEETSAIEALRRVPLAAARERLEHIGTPGAVAALGDRPDAVLAVRALDGLRRSHHESVRFAAEDALLRLGAPGSTPFLRSQLSQPTLSSLLSSLMASPFDVGLIRQAIERAGSGPDVFAAMSQFHERHPQEFLPWLSSENEALRERAQLVMALSGDERRLPLLIDLAVGQGSESSRAAAFRGLAELELGSFERRLHRLAGHHDRRIRFLTAAALAPTGQAWTLRLLVAELDGKDRSELLLARRAVARLERDDARKLLKAMILDETASPFAASVYLELATPDGLRPIERRLWQILAPHVSTGDRIALLAAARLSRREARAAVRRFLEGA